MPEHYTLPRSRVIELSGNHLLNPFSDKRESGSLYRASQGTIDEVSKLATQGIDVKLLDTAPKYALDPATQQDVDLAVDSLSDIPDAAKILFNPTLHPTGNVWFQLTKRAIALHTLYNIGDIRTLGDGIDPEVFEYPLFDGLSAFQILSDKDGEVKAKATLEKYKRFIDTPIEDGTGYYPSSKDFLMGVVDSQAVQTRVSAAINAAERHVLENYRQNSGKEIVCASLACGSAGPIFEMSKRLERIGIKTGKLILVDSDPMALASAYSLAGTVGVMDKIEIQKSNILTTDLREVVNPNSVDIVDLLGIFEYIPTTFKLHGISHPAAETFLKNVLEIVKPGGLIVMGNMLVERPQQNFFKKVWPRLFQRSISEVLRIIDNSGLDSTETSITIPAREGVYAIYAIKKGKVKENSYDDSHNRNLSRLALNRLTY